MIEEHFREFQKKNKFRTTEKEPTCYSCKGFDSVDGFQFICLLSERDQNYMKVFITTVCKKFSPA
jgi:hypothetical protein